MTCPVRAGHGRMRRAFRTTRQAAGGARRNRLKRHQAGQRSDDQECRDQEPGCAENPKPLCLDSFHESAGDSVTCFSDVQETKCGACILRVKVTGAAPGPLSNFTKQPLTSAPCSSSSWSTERRMFFRQTRAEMRTTRCFFD